MTRSMNSIQFMKILSDKKITKYPNLFIQCIKNIEYIDLEHLLQKWQPLQPYHISGPLSCDGSCLKCPFYDVSCECINIIDLHSFNNGEYDASLLLQMKRLIDEIDKDN